MTTPLRLLLAALFLCLIPFAARAQPKIDLPSDEPRPAVPRPPGLDLARESQIEVPLAGHTSNASTAIGGYGEIVLNASDREDALACPERDGQCSAIDVRRLVLFIGHNFTDRLRFYSELEVEHAITSARDKGEFEVEQAFLDYLIARGVNLRAGLLIMPVGIVNQYHEPPTFNGADRPEVDTRVIPSTWREVGAGVFGGWGPLRWQGYVTTGFDALGFNADGLRDGHQEGQLARIHSGAAVARIDYQPLAALDLGVSGYYGHAGQGQVVRSADQVQALSVPDVGVGMLELDARFRWKGLEARAEFANVWVNDSPQLNQARQLAATASMSEFTPVSHQLRGGYVEAGYNLLRPFHTTYLSSLVAFARYERTDTQADVRGGYDRVPGKDRQGVTVGVNLRPIAEVALKLDYQRRTAFGTQADPAASTSWNQFNASLAWMF